MFPPATTSPETALYVLASSPPRTAAEIRALIKRMAENGMEAGRSDIALIRYHLVPLRREEVKYSAPW